MKRYRAIPVVDTGKGGAYRAWAVQKRFLFIFWRTVVIFSSPSSEESRIEAERMMLHLCLPRSSR